MNRIIILIALTCSFLFLFNIGRAQDPPDSRGTDFWLTYLPNFHNNWDSEEVYAQFGDSLYIFITSLEPTKGKIEYANRFGVDFVHEFRIDDPSKIHIFKVSAYYFELLGYNVHGTLKDQEQCETIARQSFHLTTEKDVTVYAHTQAVTTSDAFIVLPTDAIGEDYFIMTYKSDGRSASGNLTGTSTPSQFAIVASEDATDITISPSSRTKINGMNIQNIQLNRGDVYLVQSLISLSNLRRDLTGTEINSNKPIAVFAGHQRSNLPVSSGSSRDCLIEQMPPVQAWGTNAIVVPFPQPGSLTNTAKDKYRIIAANDGTHIDIGGVFQIDLDRGEFYEGDLKTPLYIDADAPILVAQFKKTGNLSSSDKAISDPLMMIIPPEEQFDNFYRCINIQAHEYAGMDAYDNPRFTQVYDEQYITIVAPNSIINAIELDGNVLPGDWFDPVPNSNFSYSWIAVDDGAHTLKALEGFGIYIYGYGYANSYGYFGGMNFFRRDFKPPDILSDVDCYVMEGAVTDTAINDSQLDRVYSPADPRRNVSLTIQSFEPYADVVGFTARLKNIYYDGEFSIIGVDSAGNETRSDYEIPGFTVKGRLAGNSEAVPLVEQTRRIGWKYCCKLELENYGKFPMLINRENIKINSGEFSVNNWGPKILQPGEIDTIEVCFLSDVQGTFIDTLVIANDCAERDVFAFRFIAETDTEAPASFQSVDSCKWFYHVVFTDSTVTDFGLAATKVLDTVNCGVIDESFGLWKATYDLGVKDPLQDAFFRIEAVDSIYHRSADSVGHRTVFEHAIPGFTISFPDFPDTSCITINSFDQGSVLIGAIKCDTIRIHNYGAFTMVFDDAEITENIYFSLPPSQFPLIIYPGETVELEVCFRPLRYSEIPVRDTLKIPYICLDKVIALLCLGDQYEGTGGSRCGVSLRLRSNSVPSGFRLEQIIPNPIIQGCRIVFAIPEKGPVSVFITDVYGRRRTLLSNMELKAGTHELYFDAAGVPQGLYFFEMAAGKVRTSKKALIMK